MPVRIGRRLFLCGTGGALLGLPALASLLPRALRASTPTQPRRFLSILSQSGQLNADWYPAHTPPGYQLHDDVYTNPAKRDGTTHLHMPLPEDSRYRYAPLSDFSRPTGISNILHEALNPFLAKMNLLRGLDFMSTVGHSYSGSSFLGNYADSTQGEVSGGIEPVPTIDEVMAYSPCVYANLPAARALHLSCGWASAGSASDYGIRGGPVETLDGIQDPRQVWQQLFEGLAPPDSPPTEDPNISLLNSVYGDYRDLANHRRLGAADRELLERHMGFLSDIEAQLREVGSADCERPTEPGSIYAGHLLDDPDQLRAAIRLMVDLSVAAIRCDLTRVVTINITNAAHDNLGAWQTALHNSADVPSDWHFYAHDASASANSRESFNAISRWIAGEVLARLLTELEVVEGADGSTMLDNSLVVWGNELSLNHYNITMPTLIAGGASGTVRTGRYIDYCNWDGDYANPIDWGLLIPGLPHNRFLVTCLQAMGLAPADYERGTPGYGSLAQISTPYAWPTAEWDLSLIGRPLPGLLTT